MEIEVSEEVLEEVEKASKKLGLRKKEVVERAVKFYLDSAKDISGLKKELEVGKRRESGV